MLNKACANIYVKVSRCDNIFKDETHFDMIGYIELYQYDSSYGKSYHQILRIFLSFC